MTQIATLDEIAPHLASLPNGSSSTFWMDCLHYFVIIRTIGTIELSLEGGEVYWKATERNCQQMHARPIFLPRTNRTWLRSCFFGLFPTREMAHRYS